MLALLTTAGPPARLDPSVPGFDELLLPVLDRPWLHHVMDRLAEAGATRVRLLHDAPAPDIRRSLGDGLPWGLDLAVGPLTSAERQSVGRHRSILVADARRLPAAEAGAHPAPSDPWKLMPGEEAVASLPRLTAAQPPVDPAGTLVWDRAGHAPPPGAFALRSWADYLAVNHPANIRRFRHLAGGAREVEPGVVLDRNVELHPSAHVEPPVFLGRDVRIGRRARIGPDVCVHRGCIVSCETDLRRTIVLPGTYVGPDLVLSEAVVAPFLIVHPRERLAVPIHDPFLIGDLEPRWWPLQIARAAARWLPGLGAVRAPAYAAGSTGAANLSDRPR